MEADGQDVRPEPLEERRKGLAKLLSRRSKAMRDGVQLSKAITGDQRPDPEATVRVMTIMLAEAY